LLCSFRKYRFKICFYILPFSLISSFAIILWYIKMLYSIL
jgi:hypothetical protein